MGRNHIARRAGDAALAAVGYDFRLLLVWLGSACVDAARARSQRQRHHLQCTLRYQIGLLYGQPTISANSARLLLKALMPCGSPITSGSMNNTERDSRRHVSPPQVYCWLRLLHDIENLRNEGK